MKNPRDMQPADKKQVEPLDLLPTMNPQWHLGKNFIVEMS
jgi:hypothetical protein